MLVVNESELAEAIQRLRGEWNERFGGTLTVAAKPWGEFQTAAALDADLIAFPARYLGELGTRGWIRPVRKNVLQNRAVAVDDLFPLVRRELITWGGEVMALPLGVHVSTGGDAIDRRPAVALLVRAAPDAVLADRVGVLFDPETMKPRIAERPFVAALAQLADARSANDVPSRAAAARLVPVLGYGDRLVAVTTSSRNAASAFELLAWLATAEISSQLVSAGDGMLPVRASLASSRAWYGSELSAGRRNELGAALAQSLSAEPCLVIPRIPGIDEYLVALDEAVRSAMDGAERPQAALQHAASRWEAITDAHGRDGQRSAYLKHLGIAE